jgi:protein-tyrosine-phosphatase
MPKLIPRLFRSLLEEHAVTAKPSVLFVCVHNAGRSQMAAGFLAHLAGSRIDVLSAGSTPADQVNPVAVAAMREVGIDISTETPKILTLDAVRASDVCITMGCGDTCPVFPGKRYLDWSLDDPAGQGIEAVRPIRDEIERRVRALIDELSPDRESGEAETTGTETWRTAPIACTLPAANLGERTAEWRRLLEGASHAPIPDGLRLTLPADRAEALTALAAAEQECCSFFDFRIAVDEPFVHVEVRAPADAQAVLTDLFAQAPGPARSDRAATGT